MVDRDLILRKLADLGQYVSQASEYRDVTVEQYRREWKTQRIVDRTLQLAIEVCVDIANHVIADRGLRVPTTYAEAFEVLGEAELLKASLRDAMVRIARFRTSSSTNTPKSTLRSSCASFVSISRTSPGSRPPS